MKIYRIILSIILLVCVSASMCVAEESEWMNILFLGGDSRSTTGYERTDSMIVVSVNQNSGELKMTSIMRDTYVQYSINKSNRINAANVFGGPELAMKVVNENFDLDITNYVLVNMTDIMKIIDMVGGIDIEMSESERKITNQYAALYQKETGGYEGATTVDLAGKCHLNGLLAVSYARNRYTDSDYGRVMRQQNVLLAMTLFAQCDLMLLDEPFCYLDAEKSRWLCAYLKNTPRAFVLTGHGESVQRGLTAQTIEISHGTVLMYSSDIDAARLQKSVLEQRIERKNRDVAKEIELRKQEIERRRRWMKTAEVKKPHAIVVRRMKREISQLEDMRQASLYDEDLAYGFHFQFDEERWNTNEAILEAKRVCVGFDGRTVLSDVSFRIRMYDHVFLRGANGSGKTTLLNTIAGKFQPESGVLWRKPGLRVGYFEQMFSEQYHALTVYEYCVEHRKMGLGEYDRWKKRLFREEAELDAKKLYMLSGGERAKVELMPLLSEPVDLLMRMNRALRWRRRRASS